MDWALEHPRTSPQPVIAGTPIRALVALPSRIVAKSLDPAVAFNMLRFGSSTLPNTATKETSAGGGGF